MDLKDVKVGQLLTATVMLRKPPYKEDPIPVKKWAVVEEHKGDHVVVRFDDGTIMGLTKKMLLAFKEEL